MMPDPYHQRYVKDRIIIVESGCWIWQRSKTAGGYGECAKARGDSLAHRLSYRAFVGEIPMLGVVRHKCDNPPCCNPDHLVLGTQADNVRDTIERGRNKTFTAEEVARGRAAYAANFKIPQHTIEDIVKRFNEGENKQQIADSYRIHPVTVTKIIRENRT